MEKKVRVLLFAPYFAGITIARGWNAWIATATVA